MDVNGTKFHLLLGHDDWGRCDVGARKLREHWDESSPLGENTSGFDWSNKQDALTLQRRLFKFRASRKDVAPSLENRRGADRDQFGNWFWIDESAFKIRVLSIGTNRVSDFWSSAVFDQKRKASAFGEFQPTEDEARVEMLRLSGLAVTADHRLVVGTLNPPGLLVFDLYAPSEPRWILWNEKIPFQPFDMARRCCGGVFILDRANRNYWTLGRNFNIISPNKTASTDLIKDAFQPLDQRGVRGALLQKTFETGSSIEASPLDARDAIAIVALPDNSVLILDGGPVKSAESSTVVCSKIYRYKFDKQIGPPLLTDKLLTLFDEESFESLDLRGYDIAFAPESETKEESKNSGRLYVASREGNQCFVFDLRFDEKSAEIKPIAEFLPMRLFGGKGLVAADANAFYDFGERWIPLIEQRRPRFETEATLVTQSFDGKEPDCVWHRLMIDAFIPPETSVEVWSRAANDKESLLAAEWHKEPCLYLRSDGPELPFLRWKNFGCNREKKTLASGEGTWELLFQRAKGRFMQLKIKLSGDERSTPRLKSLRAYYPRFSYLNNYLPAVYREDETSASFLDRFLANVEGMYTTLEDKIAAVQVLFDTRSAPVEVLDWLAGWFGVALDPAWDETKRRLFISHAMDFFQYRGTIRGLRLALRLVLDDCADERIFDEQMEKNEREHGIRIVEKYLTRSTPGVVVGDPTEQIAPRLVRQTARWTPEQGGEILNTRYRDLLKAANIKEVSETPTIKSALVSANLSKFERKIINRNIVVGLGGPGGLSSITLNAALNAKNLALAGNQPKRFPTIPPSNKDELTLWSQFSNEVLGFVPSGKSVHKRKLWQDFLARRYHRIAALNQAHNSKWSGFESVELFEQLPQDGAPLDDWYQFESIVMNMQNKAHRFSVLLPMPLRTATFDWEEQQRRFELARRIINLEKPAHTVFEVKFYWALFRVGEARLGMDTLLDLGSRAPQLNPPFVLGQNYLGESHIAPLIPEDVKDRYVLGREMLSS